VRCNGFKQGDSSSVADAVPAKVQVLQRLCSEPPRKRPRPVLLNAIDAKILK
jgi:hypothetical protein